LKLLRNWLICLFSTAPLVAAAATGPPATTADPPPVKKRRTVQRSYRAPQWPPSLGAHDQNGRTFSAPRIKDAIDINLDGALIDSMLGDYDAGPAIRMTISWDAGRVFSQLTGQPKFELGALSDTELYLKQWNAQLTVVRDSSGKVTGVISHQNGTDREWPKLETP